MEYLIENQKGKERKGGRFDLIFTQQIESGVSFLRAKTMSNDPIIQETRQLRESYAEEHGHNIDAIFQDILRRQKESSKKFVRLPPRSPDKKWKSPNTVI